ncbi:MAG: hypothetical protein ACRCX2_22035 [Paraclostridium sp.]
MYKEGDRVRVVWLGEKELEKHDNELGEIDIYDELAANEYIGEVKEVNENEYLVVFADKRQAYFKEYALEKAIDVDLIEIDVVVTDCCDRCSYFGDKCLIWNIDVCWDNVCSKFNEA